MDSGNRVQGGYVRNMKSKKIGGNCTGWPSGIGRDSYEKAKLCERKEKGRGSDPTSPIYKKKKERNGQSVGRGEKSLQAKNRMGGGGKTMRYQHCHGLQRGSEGKDRSFLRGRVWKSWGGKLDEKKEQSNERVARRDLNKRVGKPL